MTFITDKIYDSSLDCGVCACVYESVCDRPNKRVSYIEIIVNFRVKHCHLPFIHSFAHSMSKYTFESKLLSILKTKANKFFTIPLLKFSSLPTKSLPFFKRVYTFNSHCIDMYDICLNI